jgi:hypothetical protein
MSEIGLQRAGIDPIIRQFEPAGVPKHVSMRLDVEPGLGSGPLDHAGKAWGRKWCSPIRREHERGRRGLALVTSERPQLPASKGVSGRRAVLKPADVQGGRFEIDLLSSQVDHLGLSEPVPISE